MRADHKSKDVLEEMEILFWVFAAAVAYVYAGYPLLLLLANRLGAHRPVALNDAQPAVTLLVSAFNEQEVIAEKIRNSLAIDYPREKLQIIVISDASEDRTDEIVRSFAGEGVELLRMPDRSGKTLGLNEAVARATGEIVVFSDANAMYARDSLRRLTRNFAAPEVGAVVGESTYSSPEVESERSEGLYWKYETAIKRLETRIGSVVGGDGAIYAVRRALYVPMRADALSDFVNPLQVVRGGHRCVYEPQAISVESAAESFRKEFRRKVRIVNRAWRALFTMPQLLNPLRHGFFAIELISHKLLRWLVPAMLVGVFLTSLALLGEGPVYVAAFALQLAFYALALVGFALRHRSKMPALVSVPFYFCLVNWAAALGIAEALRGKTYTVWTTARAPGR
jgi:cellulose synthase/poly-beta-1,6-N-acetylglucosamine synthase-like glycosyltransferase